MYLAVSLVAGALQLGGCVAPDDTLSSEPADDSAALVAADLADQNVHKSCDNPITFSASELQKPETSARIAALALAGCEADLYFHPTNGAPGGWIEGHRLCNRGGTLWQICTGGSAPVRYWNASSCGGTIHDFYPQGWHGNGQSFKVCC